MTQVILAHGGSRCVGTRLAPRKGWWMLVSPTTPILRWRRLELRPLAAQTVTLPLKGDARPETGSPRAGGMVLVFHPILKIILGVEGIRRKVPPVLYQVEGKRVMGCQQDQDA